MPSVFKKLFRRKAKDPAAAGILSDSTASAPPQQKQTRKEKKASKREAKQQKKKDKLAGFPSNASNVANGAGANGAGGVGGGFGGERTKGANGGQAADMNGAAFPGSNPSGSPFSDDQAWEDQKENSVFTGFPTSGSSNGGNSDGFGSFPTSSNGGGGLTVNTRYGNDGFYDDDLYNKPALSMIAEEKSPTRGAQGLSPRSAASNGSRSSGFGGNALGGGGDDGFGAVASPRGPEGAPSPRSAASARSSGRVGFEEEDDDHQPPPPPPQAPPPPPAVLSVHPPATSGPSPPMGAPGILSPMSGNKPPLTPNRAAHRTSTGSAGSGGGFPSSGATPSQFRSPSLSSAGGNNEGGGRHSVSPGDGESLRGMRLAGSEEMMCLSADDDDEEYERLRRGAVAGGGAGAAASGSAGGAASSNGGGGKEKFVSALDRSPFSYASEEDDNALFPALVEDGADPWNPAAASSARGKGDLRILPMSHETQEDIRAWTPSPHDARESKFTFQGGGSGAAPASGGKKASEGGGNSNNKVIFENFADFEPFDMSQNEFSKASRGNSGHGSSSKSVAVGVSPVSALLEDSRARRKSGHRSIEGGAVVGGGGSAGGGVAGFLRASGGSSINSAPVLTPSNIRSHARSAVTGSKSGNISRVIDNLELHVNKRRSGGGGGTGAGRSVNSHQSRERSVHSRSEAGASSSAASAIRDAKERIRRENLMNSEGKVIDMLAAGGSAAGANGASGGKDGWLFDEVAGTLGPRSVAADLESLGGRSNKSGKSRSSLGGKSHRSHRSHRSKKSSSRSQAGGGGGTRRHRSSRHHHGDDGVSVDSRQSRNSRASYRSYATTKSMVSQMSEQSRSVANDLLRLEAQLSMVGKSRNGGSVATGGGASAGGSTISGGLPGGAAASVVSKAELNKRRDDCGMTVTSRDFSVSRSRSGALKYHSSSSSSRSGRDHISASAKRAAARTMRSKVTVTAPPGKLGIILANRTDSRGTVVSGVRTSSVLAEQVSPGDRIIAIDDEDVSQMNVKEITTIMARKSEFERVLVLLAAPKVQYD